MRPAGASSSSSAERPANVLARPSGAGESAIPFSSAEQPATSSDLKITCIRDVQRWLASEAIARYSTADLESIREAAAALSTPQPRQEDVRLFNKKWQLGSWRDKTHYERVQESKGKSSKRHKSCSNNYETVSHSLLRVRPNSLFVWKKHPDNKLRAVVLNSLLRAMWSNLRVWIQLTV